MSYEIGGRADKFGNRYEARWLAELLLRLSKEHILSLIHERVGIDGIDLQVNNLDGSIEFHQCKGRNGNKDSWTLSELHSKNIFSYARKCLDDDVHHSYKLISPLRCEMMETLIQRAKNSTDSPEEFYEFQIKAIADKNSPEIEKAFHSFQRCMGLIPDNTLSIQKAIDYLSRMEFIPVPDTEYTKIQLTSRISDIFRSDSRNIYDIFVNYTIENNRLGHTITTLEINEYLSARGIYKYDLSNHFQIWPRIQELNNEFESSFVSINDTLIHREETDEIFSLLLQNTSVILHGKAGAGKSGCVLELISKLKQSRIPYLALKLDKRIPEKSAEQYGTDTLGLPASPILCLSRMAHNTVGVLILDQLDAIRWTTQHTQTALAVCKELVAQMERINSDLRSGVKISILFICRTFDVETDNGIKALFAPDKAQKNYTRWEKAKIGDLAEQDVKTIVGELYTQFTPKFQKLLKNVNNLYIWSKLNSEHKKIQYASTYRLIQGYWKQLEQHCDAQGILYNDLFTLRTILIT